MARTRSKNEDGSAPRAEVTQTAEQFRQLARRLTRAAREIEIVNRISGRELFVHEFDVGLAEAVTANRAATNVGSMPPQAVRDELRRLKASADNVADHAWRGTAFYAHSIGEVDIYKLRNGQRQGLLMELVMLRSASKPVPQRLIDKYMTDAGRAEMFMRLLAA